MKQHVESGIGRAFRRAREERGKSLEEVSRETRMRMDQLRAIEHEWFGSLGSDVYVRGFLSSYARYLGLSPEKVVGAYERAFGGGKPAPAPVEEAATVAPTEALVLTERKRPNWLLAGAAALIVLSAAAAIGIFGRTDSVPQTSDLQPPPAQPVAGRPVELGIQALGDVEVAVVVDDGIEERHALTKGEGIQFVGEERIELSADTGGRFILIVNGHEWKRAGEQQVPFDMTFTPESFRDSGEDERSTIATPTG